MKKVAKIQEKKKINLGLASTNLLIVGQIFSSSVLMLVFMLVSLISSYDEKIRENIEIDFFRISYRKKLRNSFLSQLCMPYIAI